MIVVDASLAVKWLVLEPDSQLAYSVLDVHAGEIAAPELLLSAASGAVVRRANMGEITPAQGAAMIEQWIGFWRDGVVDAHRLSLDLVQSAATLAMAIRHPIADCIYLALAIEQGGTLVTCDAKFKAQAGDRFAPHIKLLSEFA